MFAMPAYPVQINFNDGSVLVLRDVTDHVRAMVRCMRNGGHLSVGLMWQGGAAMGCPRCLTGCVGVD